MKCLRHFEVFRWIVNVIPDMYQNKVRKLFNDKRKWKVSFGIHCFLKKDEM